MEEEPMVKKILISLLFLTFISSAAVWISAQESGPDDTVFRITVDMVQLNVAVTDTKGNYVTGLRPWDFQITEDGIQQKLATFGEGNEPPRKLADFPQEDSKPKVIQTYSAKVSRRLTDNSP